MNINVEHLLKISDTLEQSLIGLEDEEINTIRYDLFRNAAIKSFELSLETAGKLLRRVLKYYVGSPREVDKLVFNDVFRSAQKYGLLDIEAVERWLNYRANRNSTAHDYGEDFAEKTLKLLPHYLIDLRQLANLIQERFNAETVV